MPTTVQVAQNTPPEAHVLGESAVNFGKAILIGINENVAPQAREDLLHA